ncbi:MAG: carbamoyltransferase [Flavobacteriales bacterium]|nr:carbamoyltransferase [Flavobacteriales bacterium]
MNILGVSAFYHDSAAAIIQNDEIIAAAQEERFTRIKQDASFPVNAVKYCLEEAGLTLDELDAIVFYDKPLLKFERLLETYYGYSPKGIASFLSSMPVWLKEKMFLKRLMHQELEKVESYDKKKIKFLFPEHHLSHAASAFYPSPFNDAAILTIDGVGEWATASISHGKGNKIEVIKELHFPHSLGLLYSAFTYFLGFKVNSGEYKLMGLAPYGNPESKEVQQFIKLIKTELIDIKEDGSLWLNQSYFNYATGLRMIKEKKWETLFGIPTRKTESDFEQVHCNLGLAIQIITEEVVLKMALEAQKITGSKNLCLAGGVALNCVSNGKLINSNIFENVYIQPASGDAGGALGAALAAYYISFDNARITDNSKYDAMKGSYLGCDYSNKEIETTLKKYKAVFHKENDFSEVCQKTANYLDDGLVIGWFQGRMEFGPRSLGNRSIIGDPRNTEMQKKLNLKIKYRESFRPFAPSVLAKDANKYFDIKSASPYMLTVQPVKKDLRKQVSDDYQTLTMKEKLYQQRSTLPSITHVDFSARIQTVHKETNPKYWELINTFKQKTACSLVINTSFNVRGEPIVCSPEDAYRCFMRTEMDYLVLNNYILRKEDQPNWTEKDHWQEEFVLD